jgi:hypothetical protein
VQPISWNSEALFPMPVRTWHELMDTCFPGSAWIVLGRDLFARLWAIKRRRGLSNWDELLEELVRQGEAEPEAVEVAG